MESVKSGLDLIIKTLINIPVAKKSLEVDDHFLLMFSEVTTLDSRAKIISPSKPTTLAASKQTCQKSPPQKKKVNIIMYSRAFRSIKYKTLLNITTAQKEKEPQERKGKRKKGKFFGVGYIPVLVGTALQLPGPCS